MIAYKGFHGDLTCTFGKGTFQYEAGATITEELSKCARNGLHCAEYVLDCLKWYPLGRGNRYFQVEAEGNIDEDGTDTKISCTKMTLVRELNVKEIALQAMIYICSHPHRDWKHWSNICSVTEDSAEGCGEGSIAIARGKCPVVKGEIGTAAGLLVESPDSVEIEAAKFFVIDGKKVKAGKYYGYRNGELVEARG